ncbi:MAG: hypothetical protein P9M07_03570 [Candidatus Aceula meridiana]|nr:hypothetical protein [Candidatus Aceula meridiana]
MYKTKQCTITLCVLGLFFVSVFTTGCEPLRKKFTRKKSSDRVEVVDEPILDPIDYPDRVYDSVADYKYRFSLFHVWKKEFISSIDDNATPKRMQYLLGSAIVQAEEMSKLLKAEKRVALEKDIVGLKAIQKKIEGPEQFYNAADIKRKTNSLSQKIRSDYNPRDIEADIILYN